MQFHEVGRCPQAGLEQGQERVETFVMRPDLHDHARFHQYLHLAAGERDLARAAERIDLPQHVAVVRQLGVRHLQLGLLAGNDRPVLAPVELERFARMEHQRHEDTAPAGLGITLSVGLPAARKGCNTAIGTIEAQGDEIGVHLLHRAPLLARATSLDPQPTRQLLGKRVQLARLVGLLESGLNRTAAKVLADRVARQFRASLNLPDRHPLTKMPTPDYAQ